jgi:hypothetical protein
MIEMDGTVDMKYVFTRFVIVEKYIKTNVQRYDTPDFDRDGVVRKWDNYWSSGFSSRIFFISPGIYTREEDITAAQSLLPYALNIENYSVSPVYIASTDVATNSVTDLEITIFRYDSIKIPDDG